MKLSVRDAAKLLDVSEKTIYRWVAQRRLPGHRINEQYRFNRAELLEWATAQRVPVSPQLLLEPDDVAPGRLDDALRAGGIFYRVGGQDKASVLRNVVDLMPLPEEVDRGHLLEVLLARESLGSTGIGEGLAIPHVRNPIVLHVPKPMISLCFLEAPIEFGAIDRQPVHTLFAIVSPTIRAHLALLSKLAHGLRGCPFADAVKRQALREDILEAAGLLETVLATPGEQDPGT
jgi:PTS system nitrogen regulatory IIA component